MKNKDWVCPIAQVYLRSRTYEEKRVLYDVLESNPCQCAMFVDTGDPALIPSIYIVLQRTALHHEITMQ